MRSSICLNADKKRLIFAANAMQSNNLYDQLRRLVIEDPNSARTEFLRQFDASSADIDDFLVRLQAPREGRLRQLVANAVRNHNEKNRILEHLFSWDATETYEFNRSDIYAGLHKVVKATFRFTLSSS